MSNDKFESLKKRMSDQMDATSRRLAERLGGSTHSAPQSLETAPSMPPSERVSLQIGSHETFERESAGQAATIASANLQNTVGNARPPAPTGKWRCIVNSGVVSVDLMANIAQNGTLSGQGTIIYVNTHKVYEVSGQGDWLLFPPETEAPNWLFKFRLKPSNHAFLSWFAGPTDSPNHLANRFEAPSGHTVITRCERVG